VAADVNTSDPYCKLLVNGQETGNQTSAIQATLAPQWNESFEMLIYHPLDIVTVSVHDKDFGTSLGELDVLGLDDDFLGWVDIPIIKLPQNRQVHGWFELHPESHYEDSVEGRRRKGIPGGVGAGHLHLSMKLKVKQPRDELFALMLPKPHFGEVLPVLDVVTIFDTYTEIKAELRIWQVALNQIREESPRNPWITMATLVFIVWTPEYFLCIFSCGCAYLAGKGWLRSLREHQKTETKKSSLLFQMRRSVRLACTKLRRRSFARLDDQGIALSEPLLPVDAIPPSPSRPHTPSRKKTLRNILDEKLGKPTSSKSLDVAAQARLKHQHARLEKTAEDEKEEKAIHKLGESLSNLTPLVPGKDKIDMRRIQKVLADATEQVETINDFVDEESHLFLVFMMLTLAAVFFGLVHDWTGVALQVILTVVICGALLKESFLGRFLIALLALMSISSRRRKLHFELALRKDAEGSATLNKDLSRYLVNLDLKKRHEPAQRTLTAKGYAHELVRYTYVEPTWCYGCGGFLWGIHGQGLQCKFCQRNFCKACGRSASDTLEGPRSCEVERPDGWEETDSVSSFADLRSLASHASTTSMRTTFISGSGSLGSGSFQDSTKTVRN
jgi:hypothetical protein